MGPMRYTFYTTNSTADVDSRISSLAVGGTRFNTNQFATNGSSTTIKSGALLTNTIADLRNGQIFSFKLLTAQYDFRRSGSSLVLSNTADGSTLEILNNGMKFMAPDGTVLARLDTASGSTVYSGTWYGKFSGDGAAITNFPGGMIYGGTASERNAFVPDSSYAFWVITDSTPPYQISVWSGGTWN